jgi:hypothetical protein
VAVAVAVVPVAVAAAVVVVAAATTNCSARLFHGPLREGAVAFCFWRGREGEFSRTCGLRGWIFCEFRTLSVFIRGHLWLESFADADDAAH